MSLVSRLFYRVVNVDSCWKEAFIKYFGVSIPFKRLDSRSWRAEYIKRMRLLRRWEKGRGSNVLLDLKIGRISNLWAEDGKQSEGWFLAGGRAEGVLARCSPSQGKVQKDVVFRINHLVNAEVTAMAIDRHRTVWGLVNGQVALTTLAYGAAGQTFQTFAGFHRGPVSCVKLVRQHYEFALTGGVDGTVRLWDVPRSQCIREFRSEAGSTRIDHICCDPGSHIVAGASNGEIYVWEVDVNAILSRRHAPEDASISSDDIDSDVLPGVIRLPEEFKGVNYLEVNFAANHSGLILAQAADANVLHMYSLDRLTHLATLESPVHGSPISAVYWDIPKYEKPMISTSNGIHNHIPHGRQEKTNLVATGDHVGNVCLWYLNDAVRRRILGEHGTNLTPNQAIREVQIIEPTFALKAHDTTVTSLFVDALVIVSGSMDGSAMAWNPVNGELISVLNSGHIRGRDINDQNGLAVKCIEVDSLQCRGVLSAGNLIKSWDFSPDAIATKDKHRKPTTRRPIHYSAGAKNRIENDIRNSLIETASLRRLEALAKDRREQLHRRYNNLEGLNMADMTDEEITQYVMLLSKQQDDQDEQEAAQVAREIRLIQEMKTELALKQQTHSLLDDNGEGSSSSSAQSGWLSTATPSQQELEEEEEMVRRVIAMSLLEVDPSPDDAHSHHHAQGHSSLHDEDTQESHDHVYQPTDWETSQVVNVDGLKRDDHEKQEDEQIVKSILRELEEVEDDKAPSQGANDENSPGDVRPPQAKNVHSGEAPKMTWSMIARVNNESPAPAASGLQPAIIKQYPRDASQEEIEDEDTQLARILSLSMVEK
ncbi:MAG: WD40-repeat-containing domain protein [Benniella sp.]|nr:MAG: WD40-repeat-containing domain protein [Benniella sp.]